LFQLRKSTILFIRLGVAAFAYGFIIYKLCDYSWHEISSVFQTSLNSSSPVFLFLFTALMPVNWLIEAFKWKFSLKDFERIGLIEAYKSVWYGIVTGIITPNRIGEPVGKIALISKNNRGKALLVAFWCSASQQVATVFFGVVGLTIWTYSSNLKNIVSQNLTAYISVIVLAITTLLFFILKINWFSAFLGKKKITKRFLSGENLSLNISIKQSFIIIGLSILRYLIFSSQFILILQFFGVDSKIMLLFSAIALTYMATSFIPTFFFSEAGVRTGFALAFIGTLTSNSVAIISGTILLWVLNVGLPAAIATWFPWHSKINQN